MSDILVVLLLIWVVYVQSSKTKNKRSDYTDNSQKRYLNVYANKGELGENRLYNLLVKLNVPGKVLPNVYVPKRDGSTTEIDTVLLLRTGIYVFESKNYSGWIYGKERRKNWTQTFKNGTKHSFFNPIWQNYGHVKALSEFLHMDEEYFHSIIVFGDNATIKSEELLEASIPVMKRDQLNKKINDELNTLPILLSNEDIECLFEMLRPLTQVTAEVKSKHIESLKQKHLVK